MNVSLEYLKRCSSQTGYPVLPLEKVVRMGEMAGSGSNVLPGLHHGDPVPGNVVNGVGSASDDRGLFQERKRPAENAQGTNQPLPTGWRRHIYEGPFRAGRGPGLKNRSPNAPAPPTHRPGLVGENLQLACVRVRSCVTIGSVAQHATYRAAYWRLTAFGGGVQENGQWHH